MEVVMKYFDTSKTTNQVVTCIRQLENTELEKELLQFIEECEKADSLSKEYIERFFKIVDAFLEVFPGSSLDSQHLKKLLTLLHEKIKTEEVWAEIFYRDTSNISAYSRLFRELIVRVSTYDQIRDFVDRGSIFGTLLESRESVSHTVTRLNLLILIYFVFTFLFISDTDK
ncbi:TPA: DUF2971 domain-containing protein, partial [Streptococcus suis]|nr:DUF2971 domain-containing protein [Streptococcus suis]HEM2942304.1 DUF2971 domain-containing protein [Streptococcus suis]HEM5360622.1 DUF2971 domain-containing protein [Streptococcus suis]